MAQVLGTTVGRRSSSPSSIAHAVTDGESTRHGWATDRAEGGVSDLVHRGGTNDRAMAKVSGLVHRGGTNDRAMARGAGGIPL